MNLPASTPPRQGRKASINREDIIQAALTLVGPNRQLSTLSLREVAREAGIAPNSFYRHFRDMDELAVALIDLAGRSLREIIGQARQRATQEGSVVRSSIESFMEQLGADQKLLHILLREGSVGSDAFKDAVERELSYFEEELREDLIRLTTASGNQLMHPALTSRAITRLVFAVGASTMDLPPEQWGQVREELIVMVRMILAGSNALARQPGAEMR